MISLLNIDTGRSREEAALTERANEQSHVLREWKREGEGKRKKCMTCCQEIYCILPQPILTWCDRLACPLPQYSNPQWKCVSDILLPVGKKAGRARGILTEISEGVEMQHNLCTFAATSIDRGTCPRICINTFVGDCTAREQELTGNVFLLNSVPKTYNSLSDRVVKHPLPLQILTRQLHQPRRFSASPENTSTLLYKHTHSLN